MKILEKELKQRLNNLGLDDTATFSLSDEVTAYPFGRITNLMAYMLANGFLTFNEYLNLEEEYNKRNRYLRLFELSPRKFGEEWGEQHIRKLFPAFTKETRQHNPSFDGEYDLILDNIRVEVKACRANGGKSGSSLLDCAYSHSEAVENNFKYHFQQLKPSCCDVFIWIGVCKDELMYWVLTSEELKKSRKLTLQHRSEHTDENSQDIFEGQVFMTEQELQPYRVSAEKIQDMVIKKRNQTKQKGSIDDLKDML